MGNKNAKPSPYDYDLVTIGGGSGGVRASRLAAADGKKVAIIELPFDPVSSESTGGFGGTCVIRGCVPKKLFVYGSHFHEEFEDAEGFGWNIHTPPKFNWQHLMAQKTKEITRLNGIYAKMLNNAGAEIFEGRGKLIDAHTVEVTDAAGHKTLLKTANTCIATGGYAFKLPIPGAELGITSDEALTLPDLPRKVCIIGGGYIAVEFAGIFNGLGAEVHLVFRQELPLRGFDEDVRAAVNENLIKRGIIVHPKCNPKSLAEASAGTITVETDSGQLTVNTVMFATGRKPNISRPDLGLSEVGVELDHGAIKVDAFSRTNVNGVWAIGDVTNRVNLTPVALMEGAAMMASAMKGRMTKPDYQYIPSAVFCQPPVASCGLSEQEAVSNGHTCDVYLASFR
ncbi:hypothetical protein CYMTET_55976 [Cymbomonas tetramitiformis]|uniref:glutathione-disulfide reductase n=1 Tax=Cymbomonas tetramitiformis TaxID=36881 RepID=A0AAE0BBV2_9CHLO|nr:hypothetical protein CYMTET_55976 [Cymbomonas tetramitiformis]